MREEERVGAVVQGGELPFSSTDERTPQGLCLASPLSSSVTASYRDTYAATNARKCRMNASHTT